MNKTLLIGYFGYDNNQIDGQTIKTRLVSEVLGNLESNNFDFYDTQKMKSNPIKTLFSIFIKVMKAKNIFIMPGKNGLKIIFPFIYFISFFNIFSKKHIHYIVVGGWLSNFLKEHTFIKKLLTNIDGIYLESNLMKNMLVEQNVKNVKVLYNFRKIDNIQTNTNSNEFKIVFFSRITETKGIFDLIEVMKSIDRTVLLDFYGPIDKDIEDRFLNAINEFENIQYKGILRDKMYQTLSEYKFMVFPTYYEGEGFPGAVIDAYISGLPIIASNWKYNFEFVKDNKTGLLFETRNINELATKITYLKNNPMILDTMKTHIKEEIKNYSFNNAENIFKKIII